MNAGVSPRFSGRVAFHIAVLTILFSTAAILESGRLTALSTNDIWWHWRTGTWMLAQHSVPHTGLFSRYENLTWRNANWLFDLILGSVGSWLGFRAVIVLMMAMKIGFAALTYLLGRAAGARFWSAVLLSALAQWFTSSAIAMTSCVSILLFGTELLLIVRSRRTGSGGPLFCLPLLFLLWANVDLQFVNGLILFAIYFVATACEWVFERRPLTWVSAGKRPARIALIVSATATLAATLLNPYGVRLYDDVGQTLYSSVGFQYFAEMHAMSFRTAREFGLMLFVMAAFLALGRRKSVDVFETLLLVAGTLVAFRIQRDVWLAVLPALVVIGKDFANNSRDDFPDTKSGSWQTAVIAALTMAAFLGAAFRTPDDRAILRELRQTYPIAACDFIEANHLPSPLFNTYSWGGFLTAYLRDYPVFIDSRVSLYGEERLAEYFQVMGGKTRLDADPAFASSRTLLLERQSGITKALTDIPVLRAQYELVYGDDVAAVFVRRVAPGS